MAAYSATLRGASRVFVIDSVKERLDAAKKIGCESVDFSKVDAVEEIIKLNGGMVDRSVDAVGYQASANDGKKEVPSIVLENCVSFAFLWGILLNSSVLPCCLFPSSYRPLIDILSPHRSKSPVRQVESVFQASTSLPTPVHQIVIPVRYVYLPLSLSSSHVPSLPHPLSFFSFSLSPSSPFPKTILTSHRECSSYLSASFSKKACP
jgi:hypothetical protein